MENTKQLIIIVLAGVITGMILTVPTIFMEQVLVGGILFGVVAGVIGFFATRRRTVF